MKLKYSTDGFDPYDYPPVQKTVARMFNDGTEARMLLKGQMINKPGRRFKYTDGDFLEAYWGKDGMNNQTMLAL